MTSYANENKMTEFKADLISGLRVIAMISILAATTLVVLAYPIARIFVGEYEGLVALGNVVIALMIGLLPFSLNFFMQKAFYAIEDTKTPFYTTLVQSVTFVVLALLVGYFVTPQFIVVFLSLATSVGAILQTSLAMRAMKKRIGAFAPKLVTGLVRYLVAAAIAGAAGFFCLNLLGGYQAGSFAVASVLGAILASALISLVMVLCFFALLSLLGGAEAAEVRSVVRGSVRRLKGIARR
jgi:putative peptidoglycan lipid II flippase